MDLSAIRVEAGRWIGRALHDADETTALDAAINRAYDEVVAVIDLSGRVINLSETTESVAVTAAAREYTLEDDIRNILEIRSSLSSDRPLVLTTWHIRDKRFIDYDAYYYRSDGGGWIVGMRDAAPAAQTLTVYYQPTVSALTDAAHIPTQVPTEYHALIAYGAARMVLMQLPARPEAAGIVSAKWYVGTKRLKEHLEGFGHRSGTRPY